MTIALLYGLAASGAPVIGPAIGTRVRPPQRVTGVLLASPAGR